MEFSDDETITLPTAASWTQPQLYCLKIPELRHPRCLGRTRQDGALCGKMLVWEVCGWISMGLQLIGSFPWQQEQLKPVFEEIADISLCHDHKAQIESIAEMWRRDAWRRGWITEYHPSSGEHLRERRKRRCFAHAARIRLRAIWNRFNPLFLRSSGTHY